MTLVSNAGFSDEALTLVPYAMMAVFCFGNLTWGASKTLSTGW